MKLNKILMCAVAAGAMAFVSDNAQASKLVIDGSLYVPVNIKGPSPMWLVLARFNKRRLQANKSKSVGLRPKGTMLAIGPDQDIYAINNGVVLGNLTTLGYFSFSTSDTLDTTTGDFPTTKGTYSEVGVTTLDFASDADLEVLDDNAFAFNLTGTYIYKDSESAVVSGLYKESSTFSSKNLSGLSWITEVDEFMPVSGSASGSGSGSGVIF